MDVSNEGDQFDMVRFSLISLCIFSGLLPLSPFVRAQEVSLYKLLPDNVQACVRITEGDQLVERWDRTQLAKLATDPSLKPFFEGQRQELQQRFMDAGWRLNLQPDDLGQYATGQILAAWLELTEAPRKPFALALLADVADDPVLNQQLLDKIRGHLTAQQAVPATIRFEGVTIQKYTLPRRAGQLLAENSFFAIHNGLFMSTDDEQLMKDIIVRSGGTAVGQPLANDPVFVAGREQLRPSGEAQIEYFVRPLGIARVIRAIGGKRGKSSADVLAVLQNQGFGAIQSVCGEILLGQEYVDVQHRGFVLANRPLPESVQVLDFPNEANHDVPAFVGGELSSLLMTNWNVSEAFWKVRGLADELAGTEGVFDSVVEGIKLDVNGPQIDIRTEVLPLLTNDIFSITDSKPGEAAVDSRRNLIAIRLTDGLAMSKVLNRAMRNEPDAELLDFQGQAIWQVVHRENQAVTDLDNDDFGEFGAGSFGDEEKDKPEPWLSNWAIAVQDDYLVFASHVEMIQEAIVRAQETNVSPLVQSEDYQRIANAIDQYFGDGPICTWQMVCNSEAYRVQYELFRSGKLNESQSMLATILDRLLQKETEMEIKRQIVSGSSLPAFETIVKFLEPSGMMVRSTESGWEFGGLLLSGKRLPAEPEATLSLEATGADTARIRTVAQESNR